VDRFHVLALERSHSNSHHQLMLRRRETHVAVIRLIDINFLTVCLAPRFLRIHFNGRQLSWYLKHVAVVSTSYWADCALAWFRGHFYSLRGLISIDEIRKLYHHQCTQFKRFEWKESEQITTRVCGRSEPDSRHVICLTFYSASARIKRACMGIFQFPCACPVVVSNLCGLIL
jgi:hypothetical protein